MPLLLAWGCSFLNTLFGALVFRVQVAVWGRGPLVSVRAATRVSYCHSAGARLRVVGLLLVGDAGSRSRQADWLAQCPRCFVGSFFTIVTVCSHFFFTVKPFLSQIRVLTLFSDSYLHHTKGRGGMSEQHVLLAASCKAGAKPQ